MGESIDNNGVAEVEGNAMRVDRVGDNELKRLGGHVNFTNKQIYYSIIDPLTI
jgi:hypothetical protein